MHSGEHSSYLAPSRISSPSMFSIARHTSSLTLDALSTDQAQASSQVPFAYAPPHMDAVMRNDICQKLRDSAPLDNTTQHMVLSLIPALPFWPRELPIHVHAEGGAPDTALQSYAASAHSPQHSLAPLEVTRRSNGSYEHAMQQYDGLAAQSIRSSSVHNLFDAVLEAFKLSYPQTFEQFSLACRASTEEIGRDGDLLRYCVADQLERTTEFSSRVVGDHAHQALDEAPYLASLHRQAPAQVLDRLGISLAPRNDTQPFDNLHRQAPAQVLDRLNISLAPSDDTQPFDNLHRQAPAQVLDRLNISLAPRDDTQPFDNLHRQTPAQVLDRRNISLAPRNDTQPFDNLHRQAPTRGPDLTGTTQAQEVDRPPLDSLHRQDPAQVFESVGGIANREARSNPINRVLQRVSQWISSFSRRQ